MGPGKQLQNFLNFFTSVIIIDVVKHKFRTKLVENVDKAGRQFTSMYGP